jgi:uncharacterized protein (DUF302 family)
MNPKGITVRPSKYAVIETTNRLNVFLQRHVSNKYLRIYQQSEVSQTGQDLAPLESLMIGNPKSGGHLTIANPDAALDRPSKIIDCADHGKKYRMAYNDATYLNERYALHDNITPSLELGGLISKALVTTF